MQNKKDSRISLPFSAWLFTGHKKTPILYNLGVSKVHIIKVGNYTFVEVKLR